MGCKTKQRLIDKFVAQGAIDKDTNKITEYGLFDKLNNQFTDTAKTKYHVGDGKTLLFSPSVTSAGLFAEPNEMLLDILDEAIENFNKYNKKSEEIPHTYDKINSLIDESKESIFVEQTESKTNTQERVDSRESMVNHVLFDDKEGNFTATEVLQNILKNYDNIDADTTKLLERTVLMVNKTKATVKFVKEFPAPYEDVFMLYNNAENSISIKKEILKDYGLDITIKSFIHEVVHSLTVQAFRTPTSPEAKEFRDFIRKQYASYKAKSNGSTSYGFTNEVEFIAEVFSNPEFQAELNYIDQGGYSIWQQFLYFVSGIFGLKSQKFSDIIESIVNIVELTETTESNKEGGLYAKVNTANNFVKPDTTTIDQRLQRVVNIASGNLKQALARSRKSTKKSATRQQFQADIEALIKTMDEYTDVKQWQSITAYIAALNGTVNILTKRLAKEDPNRDDILEVINSYEEYLATFDMLDKIEKLAADGKKSTSAIVDKAELAKINKALNKIKGKHTALVNDFVQFKADHMVKILANNKYLTQVETDWRIKLEKEYRDLKIISESKTEWITRQMNTERKAEIDADLATKAQEIVEGVDYDITKSVASLADPLNTNGKLFQVVVNMIAGTRNRINERILEVDFELDALHKELIKEKGTRRPSQLYKNILEQDKDGNWYVKGTYSIKFLNKLNVEYGNLRTTISQIEDKYREEGLTEDEWQLRNDWIAARNSISAWLDGVTIKYGVKLNEDGTKTKLRKVKNQWKNDFSHLSEIEQKILDKYKEISELTHKETKGRSSIITEKYGAKFYRLPSITKSDMERMVELDGKGLIKDKKEDFFKIRTDDVEFSKEAVDGRGNPLRQLRVHFRGKLDPEQQSLDLLTMMRLERLNGINYDEKSKMEHQLRAIESISGNKEYYKMSKQKGGILRNIFRVNEDAITFYGKDGGNEYNRIKSYIEGALYDNLHDSAGTFNGYDANKIIQTINSTTAFIGMSVNIASGLANVTNGFSQLMIEAMGSDHISWKSLIKAEKKYTRDIPNILADLTNPVKKSTTNQILQMFDVSGGFNISDHPFLKDTLAKKLGNTGTLSGLQEMGEHMMQSILAMAVLDNLKVMNKDSKYIDKDGNVTTEAKAASYLDMLKKDEKTGKLSMDENAKFSKHNLVTDFHNGGKSHIDILIKKKIHDTMGAYDPNLQNELYRAWYGKLLMMFKRFLIPGLQHRWKGISSAHKDKNELGENEITFNTSLKEYEEGTYTTLGRFITQGLFPTIKALELQHTSAYWKDMSDYERANLKKSVSEIAIAFGIVPLLAVLLEATFDDDEDDELIWFAAYQLRRLESELAQYLNPAEAWRITQNPIAGTRILQNTLAVLGDLLPWNWGEVDSKGNIELVKDVKKITPIWVQIDKQWKQSYNFINNQAN